MPTVETSLEISQPREVVAQAFLDPANAVYWTEGLEAFEVIRGEPGLVGSVAHLHYVEGGRRHVVEDVLEEMVPNEFFRSTVTGGGLKARVETCLRVTEGGTKVTVRWSGTGTNLRTRLLLPFLRGVIGRQMQAELETFKTMVEAHGPHFAA